MFLSVYHNDHWIYPEVGDDISELVHEVLLSLDHEREFSMPMDSGPPLSVYNPGSDAWFCFANRRLQGDADSGACYLRVAVNNATGYGGLVWSLNASDSRRGGIYDHCWISDNPEPPKIDPRVVADPSLPSFHDRRSTLPIAWIGAAVEEFCRSGTGDRPEMIRWTLGDLNGRRHDLPQQPAMSTLDDPWA